MGRKHCKTSKTRIAHSKWATEVIRLRLKGLSFTEIGKELGFSEQRAWRICTAELDRLNFIRKEKAEQLQLLELRRLDEMLKGVWEQAREGNPTAIDRVLAIMNRRARLTGIDLEGKKDSNSVGTLTLNIEEVVVTTKPKDSLPKPGDDLLLPDPSSTVKRALESDLDEEDGLDPSGD